MGQNHIGELNVGKLTTAVAAVTNDVDLYPDMVKKWGLSFLINTAKTPEGRSPGSLAWAGLANTYFWIDPARDVAGVILMQVLPFADHKCWKRSRASSAASMPGSMPAKRRRSNFGFPGAGAPTAPGNSPKGCLRLPVLPYISGISHRQMLEAWRSHFDGKTR